MSSVGTIGPLSRGRFAPLLHWLATLVKDTQVYLDVYNGTQARHQSSHFDGLVVRSQNLA